MAKQKIKFGSMASPTPELFRTIRNTALKAGTLLVAVGGAVMALPAAGVVLPAAVVAYAGYAVAYGGAISTIVAAISQATHQPSQEEQGQ